MIPPCMKARSQERGLETGLYCIVVCRNLRRIENQVRIYFSSAATIQCWGSGGGAPAGRRRRCSLLMHGPLAAALAAAHQLDYGVRNKRQRRLESWWRIKKGRDDGSATRGDTTTSRQTRGKRGGDAPLLPCKPPPKHHTIKLDGGTSGHEEPAGARQCCQQ